MGMEARAEIASDVTDCVGSGVEGADVVGVELWLGVGSGLADSEADWVGVLVTWGLISA
jgi:hypothetical protein